jgi:large subunit ribosomal protein L21
VLEIDRLDAKEGSKLTLEKVLLLSDGEKVTFGKPYVDGARVTATVNKNGKGDKIIIFKYKSKVRYRRKNGHRQLFTSLNIDRILPKGVEDTAPVKKAPAKKKVAEVKPVAELKPIAEAKPVAKAPVKKITTATKPVVKAPVEKTTAVAKPVAETPVKKEKTAVKPAAKAPAKKTTAAAKPPVKRTPRKKTEEK